jgi:hypothetical protein
VVTTFIELRVATGVQNPLDRSDAKPALDRTTAKLKEMHIYTHVPVSFSLSIVGAGQLRGRVWEQSDCKAGLFGKCAFVTRAPSAHLPM